MRGGGGGGRGVKKIGRQICVRAHVHTLTRPLDLTGSISVV